MGAFSLYKMQNYLLLSVTLYNIDITSTWFIITVNSVDSERILYMKIDRVFILTLKFCRLSLS